LLLDEPSPGGRLRLRLRGLVYRIPCGMSSTGSARLQSRDRVACVAYPAAMAASNVQGSQLCRAVKGSLMQPAITSEVVVAYAQCPRKAYLLLFSPEQGTPHEYVRVLERHRRAHQAQYLDSLTRTHMDVHPYTLEHLRHASAVLINAWLQVDGLAAACDVLTRVAGPPMADTPRYAPTIWVGTYSVSSEQKLAMLFVGYVLGRLQHMPPPAGHIIAMDGTSHAVKLDKGATHLLPL